MKKILVTGSNGFIARNFIKYALEKNKKLNIFGLNRQKGLSVDTIKLDLPYVDIYTDLVNEPCVKIVMEKIAPSVVFHFASSRKDTIDAYLNNVIGTANLMKYIPEGVRIVYSSTSETGFTNLYSTSRLAGESLIGAQSKIKNLNCVILRYAPIDPGQIENAVSATYTLGFGEASGIFNITGKN